MPFQCTAHVGEMGAALHSSQGCPGLLEIGFFSTQKNPRGAQSTCDKVKQLTDSLEGFSGEEGGIFQPRGALAWLQKVLLFPAPLTVCLPVPTAIKE